MKQRFVVLAMALLAVQCALSAQTQKGSVMIGGTAGFSASKQGEDKSSQLSFAPMAAFFVIDQLAVGGGLSFVSASDEYGGDKYTSTAFGIQPLVRYYFMGSGNIRAFGQAAFQYASYKFEGHDAQTATGFGAGLGADFFLNDHVAIEALLGYSSLKVKDAENATGTFGINLGVAAFIGGGK